MKFATTLTEKKDSQKEWSKILSDYLMYLLIHGPELTAAVIGIGPERYAGTCLEVKDLANNFGVDNWREFCTKVLEGRAKDDGVHDHEKGEVGNYRVWTEMSYPAAHCRGEVHAQSVS